MSIVFIDLEVNSQNKVVDYGAYVKKNVHFHGNKKKFAKFIKGYEYICGHNVLMHDLNYIQEEVKRAGIVKCIDTLPLSALLFAKRTYHRLVKDYKLDRNIKNNPMVDASLSHTLFFEEVEKFHSLPVQVQDIYYLLLKEKDSFRYFFEYLGYQPKNRNLFGLIKEVFDKEICNSADIDQMISKYPVELAYCLAIIREKSTNSIPPKWIVHQYKNYHYVMHLLRGNPCDECDYCKEQLDANLALKKYFGFESYRSFHGINLQEQVVKAQLKGQSIIAVFPTAGGKSLTFQIPALMMGEAVKGLTIIISPLQSLMNDQIVNLQEKNINNVGTINGSLNLFERISTIDRVKSGDIHLLYISPESLRSPSMFKLLSSRNIVRFVIDEAHCFSTWGHDFRVDYQYIAEFIQKIEEVSLDNKAIPVSCFTATAKREVLQDIKNYFHKNLEIEMNVFRTDTIRDNLHFYVKKVEGHKEKMIQIRSILDESKEQPVIIYCSRRKATEQVANELRQSGFSANAYHGGMLIELKNSNQLEFTQGSKPVIVATSAFGMGVDKSDVAYVIHYQVSSTIEDYLQEAGRGGRDKNISAQCHILFDEKDIDEHFNLLTQTKLSQYDINTIWKTIKHLTKKRHTISLSASELARKAGWEVDQSAKTKVQNSILALEKVGYVKRLENAPRVHASSIVPKSMVQASKKIEQIQNISKEDKEKLSRIVTVLFTDKTTSPSRGSKPISMIDDLYDLLEFDKHELIRLVNILKEHRILTLDSDLFAQIPSTYNKGKSLKVLNQHIRITYELINLTAGDEHTYNLKELNTSIEELEATCSVKTLRTIINFLDAKHLVKQWKSPYNSNYHHIELKYDKESILDVVNNIGEMAKFIIEYTYKLFEDDNSNNTVSYSIVELKEKFSNSESLFSREVTLAEVERALLFLHRIGAIIVDGGFLVLYNPMKIEKLEMISNKQYTKEDYKDFANYYNQKIKKIHILTHFVEQLADHQSKGMYLVKDYFNMDYREFEKKYITEDYKKYYDKAMSKNQHEKLFKGLSSMQRKIIEDKSEKNIVVLAGPGSGKTKILVHKLAALIELEDHKLSDFLMLTFSRSATIIFKDRLRELIGKRANYVKIKTFHSFCFDLIGQVGDLSKSENLFEKTIERIKNNNFEESLLNISTLVIDEAQDMSEKEYNLIKTILDYKEKELRLIAVGDDDQNIFQFRGSDSKYLKKLSEENCNTYELLINYRSRKNLVEFTQHFAFTIKNRYKEGIIESNSHKNGHIGILQYENEHFYKPITDQVKKLYGKTSIGVLTQTNEDAEILLSMLQDKNINARLIQSTSGFTLRQLYEFDWFIQQFDETSPIITIEKWNKTYAKFEEKYKNNELFYHLKKVLDGYHLLYIEKKYRIDLVEYLKEVNLQDLYESNKNIVTVSTIHKSKGREFDCVIMMINKTMTNDESHRSLYVGMTRAKELLIINSNQELFGDISVEHLTRRREKTSYERPNKLVYQMDFKDVNLGGSKYTEHFMGRVFTDDELDIGDKGCLLDSKHVLYFSKKMQDYISQKMNSSYYPQKAKVTFKVKWQDKENQKDYWILLPKIHFTFSD